MKGAGLHAVCLLNKAQGLCAACRNTDDRTATLIEQYEQEAPMPTKEPLEPAISSGSTRRTSVNGDSRKDGPITSLPSNSGLHGGCIGV